MYEGSNNYMEAHVLSLNDFNMPKVFNASDSAYVHIIQLILLEPGKYQSHPTMGIGIRSRYRYNNEDNFLDKLKSDITEQIENYLPELTGATVSLTHNDHVLGIIIDTTTGTYVVAYNSITDTMDAAATYVLNQL
jgi:hypothetical protein